MKVLEGLNVNEVFPEAVKLVSKYGVLKPSRNGPTLEIPEPVASVYHRPWERFILPGKERQSVLPLLRGVVDPGRAERRGHFEDFQFSDAGI